MLIFFNFIENKSFSADHITPHCHGLSWNRDHAPWSRSRLLLIFFRTKSHNDTIPTGAPLNSTPITALIRRYGAMRFLRNGKGRHARTLAEFESRNSADMQMSPLRHALSAKINKRERDGRFEKRSISISDLFPGIGTLRLHPPTHPQPPRVARPMLIRNNTSPCNFNCHPLDPLVIHLPNTHTYTSASKNFHYSAITWRKGEGVYKSSVFSLRLVARVIQHTSVYIRTYFVCSIRWCWLTQLSDQSNDKVFFLKY